MDDQHLEKTPLRDQFIRFAEMGCAGVSPFYERLSHLIADDQALLGLAAHCRRGQPVPNLFLGAVHHLLLMNPELPLSAYYPSLNEATAPLPFDEFSTFCRSHSEEIIEILRTRIVQTNVINRTAYLLPIILSLFERGTSINIVDIGTSAGLTLNFDHYAYRYINGMRFGRSPVRIESEIRSGQFPKIEPAIRINRKTGIDQNPLNLQQEADARWLQALIWPDLGKRFERMEQAIELSKTAGIMMVKGQSIEDFRAVLQQQEKELPLVVYHTHVLYQFPPEQRIAFRQMLDELGRERDLYYLAAEAASVFPHDYGQEGVLVVLTTYRNGAKTSRLVARTDGHANWIEWGVRKSRQ